MYILYKLPDFVFCVFLFFFGEGGIKSFVDADTLLKKNCHTFIESTKTDFKNNKQ